jgi:hypothetical protein
MAPHLVNNYLPFPSSTAARGRLWLELARTPWPELTRAAPRPSSPAPPLARAHQPRGRPCLHHPVRSLHALPDVVHARVAPRSRALAYAAPLPAFTAPSSRTPTPPPTRAAPSLCMPAHPTAGLRRAELAHPPRLPPGGARLPSGSGGDDPVIRLKHIYNFLCSMLVFTPFALCFVTLCGVFMRFLELTY